MSSIFGPKPPSLIKFKAKYPENYYSNMKNVEQELRKNSNKLAHVNESLIPIPNLQFYDQVIKRLLSDSIKFNEELEVILNI
jgi:hypothetical protein